MIDDTVEDLFDEKLKVYEDKLVEFFTDIGKHKRVNPKFLIMSVYLIIHEKLTQKQLQYLTGFSLGTISTILSVMLGTGFYEKERIPGTHEYTYRYLGNLEDLTTKGIDSALKSFLESEIFLKKKKEQLLELEKKNKKGATFLLNRIDELMSIFKIYSEILPQMSGNELNEV